jgi:hypothetical protein
MELLAIGVSVVAILVMTFLSGSVLSWIYEGGSDTPVYFRETHVSAAAINTFVVGGLLAFFFQFSLVSVVALPLLVLVTWCCVRAFVRRPEQMILWDKIYVRRLALCLVAVTFSVYVLSSMLGVAPGLQPLSMGLIFAACWALLFPL